MKINPFLEKAPELNSCVLDWKKLYAKAYNKKSVDPYTKVRIILMNGTEFESNWFLHQFHRNCTSNDIRRDIAFIRRIEQQQQKHISSLKPIDESILETTISYEQVAVDLTAMLAKREPNPYVKMALDFALLEDFDHLYRFSNLLLMDHGIAAEPLVGSYTEIMPGRPTISEHRHAFDNVRNYVDFKTASPITKLNIAIITAAEQQTMNYYMNVGQFYSSDLGRRLFAEIAMIEEQHVTHYGGLADTRCTWFEHWLMHEYTECYLYYSCMLDETDEKVKEIWTQHYNQELAHLQHVAYLLEKYEGKKWSDVIPEADFPEPLKFGSNVDYVREVLQKTVQMTTNMEEYTYLQDLEKGHRFFENQKIVNKNTLEVASHGVIKCFINENNGSDYRFQTKAHPVKELSDRNTDNTDVGRNPQIANLKMQSAHIQPSN